MNDKETTPAQPDKDEVFQLGEGWLCKVGGRVYGMWENKGAAVAGMVTEQGRLAVRKAGT